MKRSKTILKLPFKDEWFVLWGGDNKENNEYHYKVLNQKYAFDFVVIDGNNTTYRGEGKNNEDYYAFGKEIVAPANGVIVNIINNIQDNIPGSVNDKDIAGNVVIIKHTEDEFSVLAHLKQNSILVKVRDKVNQGQILGLCGNSGNSTEPHLHYHLQDSEDIYGGEGIKCYFQSINIRDKKSENEYSPVMDDIISQS